MYFKSTGRLHYSSSTCIDYSSFPVILVLHMFDEIRHLRESPKMRCVIETTDGHAMHIHIVLYAPNAVVFCRLSETNFWLYTYMQEKQLFALCFGAGIINSNDSIGLP